MKRNTSVWLSIVLLGCQGDTTGPQDELRVTAQVSPVIIRAGESVSVAITVTNHGSRTRRIAGYHCPSVFEVSNTEGSVVSPRMQLCLAVGIPPRPLQPGEPYTFRYTWGGNSLAGSTALAPGYYFLRGTVWSDDVLLKSPAVTIQINE
ncbi:MAG: hypothetical protein ACREMA_07755 [Longimicrobiales bacterium]